MKKIVSLLLGMILAMSLLAGCSGKTDTPDMTSQAEPKETTTEAPKETEPAKPELNEGYWVAEKMIMDGTEFSGSDMTDIFGSADTIASLEFGDDGVLNGIVVGDFIKGTYTGNTDKFEGEVAGEKISGGWTSDGKLELVLDKSSSFVLVNQSEMPKALAENPWVTYKIDFDGEQTAAMSNFMNYGWYHIEDNVIYGLTHAGDLSGTLGATPFEMVGDFPKFGETVILDDQGSANYLCKYEDYLYYIRSYGAICRIHTDGSGLEVLYEGSCDYLQIHDGKMYFTDENYHFVSADLDGKNVTTVVDKEIYYPYFVASDWMIFQDDADDESLHLYNTTHGTELNITYIPAYNPIVDGKYVYYVDYVDDVYSMVRIDMSDPDTFYAERNDNPLISSAFAMDESEVYIPNANSREKGKWQELTDESEAVLEQMMYVSKEYKIYHEFEEATGLISGKYLMSKEKLGATSFK